MNRRDFLQRSVLAGVAAMWLPKTIAPEKIIEAETVKSIAANVIELNYGWYLSLYKDVRYKEGDGGFLEPILGENHAELTIEHAEFLFTPEWCLERKADGKIITFKLLHRQSSVCYIGDFYVSGYSFICAYKNPVRIELNLLSSGKVIQTAA